MPSEASLAASHALFSASDVSSSSSDAGVGVASRAVGSWSKSCDSRVGSVVRRLGRSGSWNWEFEVAAGTVSSTRAALGAGASERSVDHTRFLRGIFVTAVDVDVNLQVACEELHVLESGEVARASLEVGAGLPRLNLTSPSPQQAKI